MPLPVFLARIADKLSGLDNLHLNNKLINRVFQLIVFLILLVLAVSVGVTNSRPALLSKSAAFLNNNIPEDGVGVYVTIDKVDATKRTLKTSYKVKLGSKVLMQALSQNKTLYFLSLGKEVPYKPLKDVIWEFNDVDDFESGTTDNYPFDRYTSTNALRCGYTSINSLTETSDLKKIDSLAMKIGAHPESDMFQVQLKEQRVAEGIVPVYQLEVSLQRNGLTKFFSIFINLVLIFLSVGMAGLAFTFFLSPKLAIPPPIFTLGPTMLFSIQLIRGTQPDIPRVGILLDLLVYIWSVIIISVSSIIIILVWVFRT